jgi:hypothetical protein
VYVLRQNCRAAGWRWDSRMRYYCYLPASHLQIRLSCFLHRWKKSLPLRISFLDARHTLILGSQLTLKNTQILDVPQPRKMRQTSRQISGDINLIHVMRLEVHSTTPPTPTAMGQSFMITRGPDFRQLKSRK